MSRRRLPAVVVAAVLAACGGSALPSVVEGLPAEVGGEAREDRPIDAAELEAAMAEEDVPSDAGVAGHEIRWGDETHLVVLEFENMGLNEASRVSLAMLGIGDVEAEMVLISNMTPFELTGPGIPGVAYQITPASDRLKPVMYTLIAPSEAEAATVLEAIGALRSSGE